MPLQPPVQDIFGEHPYATLVAKIRDFAIFLIDLEGCVASWNEGARLLFGFEGAEIIGQNAQRLFVPEDRQNGVPQREMETAAREGRAEDIRWHLKKDGARFWANGVMTALHNQAGNLVGFAKIARDDTARKQIDDNLRQSQERFDLVARATHDAVWDWNLETDQIWWNSNLFTIFGYQPDSIEKAAEWWKSRVHPDDRERVVSSIERAIERDGHIWQCEYRFQCADGSFTPVFDRGHVIHDPSGRPVRMLGAMVDIAERKKLEEERQIFERLAHNSPDFIAMCDLDYRPIYRNPTVEKLVGVREGETMRNPQVTDYFFPEDRDFVVNDFFPRVIREGKGTTEIRLRHLQTGAAIWMNYQLFVIRDFEGAPIALATISRDISARRQAEAEREELLQRLEFERGRLAAIFQGAPAFIAVLRGPHHVFELVNPAYYQLVGHRDIIGKNLREALPEIEGQGFIELLDEVVASGVPFEGREIKAMLQREKEGALEERFVNLIYQPLFEADGTVSGIFAHGVDVTDLVRARRAAEEANRVKDEFLATLSHELRTPLTAIMGWASILQSSALAPSEVAHGVTVIERNARAQSQLIEDILDVSRVITGKLRLEMRPIDLCEVVEAAINTVTPAAQARDIRLQNFHDEGASTVLGDPARLQQIVWNLLSNAIKFTPHEGEVKISLQQVSSHLEISVSDTGAGIAPEFLPHVFDRFRQADSSSTRSHGGLGLGLAIVRHLSELHGGSVEAHSQGSGKGATFTVKLPLVTAVSPSQRAESAPSPSPPAPANPKPSRAMPRLDGIHVLLVEDQEDTRVLLKTVLEQCGARVTATESVAQALAALPKARPDVLLSDIGMPGEDGYSLLKRVRALPAEQGGLTPAAALTAFARVEDRIQALRCGFQIHLPKPIQPLELATVVANLAGRIVP